MTAPSSFLSTVRIHCSWCIIKDLGHEEVRGWIWSPKGSAWPGKWHLRGSLAVPWAVLTHSSWAKLRWHSLLRLTALECPSWMSCCSARDVCELILTSHRPDDSPMKAEKHLGLWGLKLTSTPSRQAVRKPCGTRISLVLLPVGGCERDSVNSCNEENRSGRKDFCSGYRKIEIITKWFNYSPVRFSEWVLLLTLTPALPAEVQ